VYLRSEFKEAYRKFTDERHLFTKGIAELQEDTLMALTTCKDMERWYEKASKPWRESTTLVQSNRAEIKKNTTFEVLNESSLDRIKKSVEYWEKMSREPHREIQEKWAKCEKHWIKINRVMKDIRLPEFGTPDEFVDLRDIVESHTKQDSSWAERLGKGDRHNARSGATIYGTPDQSSGYAATVKCQSGQVSAHAVEIREIYNPDGTTQIPIRPHLRGVVHQLGRSTRRVTLLK
jgi:hypothetical protein